MRLWKKNDIPDYKIFFDIDTAYSDFFSKISNVVNTLAPEKTIRVKSTTQEWFDAEIIREISNRDKLFKKFKTSKLHVDKIGYNGARILVQNLIKKEKENFFASKLEEN